MAFKLPDDTAGVPYIGNLDSALNPAVPTEQYIKVGTLYLPVSAANPLPTSLVGSLANITGHLATVTTSGTRVQLPNTPCKEVTITGLRLNTGYIYAGGSDVSVTVYGVELGPKDSFTFAVANADQIYIDSSVSGGGISYVAI